MSPCSFPLRVPNAAANMLVLVIKTGSGGLMDELIEQLKTVETRVDHARQYL